MPQATFQFPAGFLWGTATSAHQVEGGNTNNNWAAWEAEPGRILKGGKAGLACDWWGGGRWKEDFDRAAETGQNAHRLSIEWSRIQPSPDRWNEDALDHYREIIRGLVMRNMTPMVTLHHFTDPLWLYERGGWENDETPELFAAYTARVVEALKEYVTLWITINEPNIYALMGYIDGSFPPGKSSLKLAYQVLRNMVRGHGLAYRAIHNIQPQARVGGAAIAYRSIQAERPAFLPDRWIASLGDYHFNRAFSNALVDGKFRFGLWRDTLPEAAGTQDFIGLNYYTGDVVGLTLSGHKNPHIDTEIKEDGEVKNTVPQMRFLHREFSPNTEVSDTGFIANYPQGFFEALKWAKSFGKPILVTENGIEDAEDDLRPRYMVEHIHQVWRAVNFNFPIKGYFHWTLVDNFEWERGWMQRFGLWGLDLATRTRIHRRSVDVYAAICKENGISSEMVAKYTPEILTKLFPG
jgi:beta-glucosidase